MYNSSLLGQFCGDNSYFYSFTDSMNVAFKSCSGEMKCMLSERQNWLSLNDWMIVYSTSDLSGLIQEG